MLVLVLPPVSSRVSGFPVASPCLWGKLQNLSFCHVANCENCRKSRTKCWFFCIHVSCLESLVFLWRRRVYGGSWKTYPFRMFPSRLSCRFAWQAWHFVTFQTCLIMCWNVKIGGSLVRNAGFSASMHVSSRVSGFSCGVAVSMGEAGKPVLFECVKQVVMSFCVAGVALCDIPSCLINACFSASMRLVSSLWFFLWRRRVYGGSRKISPFRKFPSRLSCRFAWQAWHFVTFQAV